MSASEESPLLNTTTLVRTEEAADAVRLSRDALSATTYNLLLRVEDTQRQIISHVERHDAWINARDVGRAEDHANLVAEQVRTAARLDALELARSMEKKGLWAMITVCLFNALSWIGTHLPVTTSHR